MTKLVFWQEASDPTVESAFEHEKRVLMGVFEIELQELREKVEQSVSPLAALMKENEKSRFKTIQEIFEDAEKRTPEEWEQIHKEQAEADVDVDQTVRLSLYDRKKLIKWFDAQDMGRDCIEMTEIQAYLKGFIVGIAFRIVLRRKDSCLCRACGSLIKWEDMGREPWEYYVNPTFAGGGYFLTCPQGHTLATIQEFIC